MKKKPFTTLEEPKVFKYPRLYARLYLNSYEISRFRIIYPDGTCEWFTFDADFTYAPCWANGFRTVLRGGHFGKCKTAQLAVKKMKAYDKDSSRQTLFLGEIK